jgi:hypothetical protein
LNLNIISDLEKALNSLRNQGISITEEHIPPDGRVFFLSPTGIALTAGQILKLRADGLLDSLGIKDFASKEKELVEEDVESTRRHISPEDLSLWTAANICEYIGQAFGRIHTIRQVTAVLNRLNIEYKRV